MTQDTGKVNRRLETVSRFAVSPFWHCACSFPSPASRVAALASAPLRKSRLSLSRAARTKLRARRREPRCSPRGPPRTRRPARRTRGPHPPPRGPWRRAPCLGRPVFFGKRFMLVRGDVRMRHPRKRALRASSPHPKSHGGRYAAFPDMRISLLIWSSQCRRKPILLYKLANLIDNK